MQHKICTLSECPSVDQILELKEELVFSTEVHTFVFFVFYLLIISSAKKKKKATKLPFDLKALSLNQYRKDVNQQHQAHYKMSLKILIYLTTIQTLVKNTILRNTVYRLIFIKIFFYKARVIWFLCQTVICELFWK